MYVILCLGCQYVVFRRADGGHCCGEMGTSQTSGVTGSDVGRLKACLVSFVALFNTHSQLMIYCYKSNITTSIFL